MLAAYDDRPQPQPRCYPGVSGCGGAMNLVGKGRWLLLLLTGTLMLSSCDTLLRPLGLSTSDSTPSTTDGGAPTGTQVLTSTDNAGQVLRNETAGIAITLPASWESAPYLHDSAELEAADPVNELYLIVVVEEDPVLQRLSLRENAERYRQLLIDNLQSFEEQADTGEAFVGEGENLFARQFEIRGQLQDGTNVVYLHTTLVSGDRYYQIVGWTRQENYAAYRSELQAITDSFREISNDETSWVQ